VLVFPMCFLSRVPLGTTASVVRECEIKPEAECLTRAHEVALLKTLQRAS